MIELIAILILLSVVFAHYFISTPKVKKEFNPYFGDKIATAVNGQEYHERIKHLERHISIYESQIMDILTKNPNSDAFSEHLAYISRKRDSMVMELNTLRSIK